MATPIEVPEVTVEILPDTTKVEFTPAQQAVFDANLKKAMGRAGADARAEAAALKLENQRLKEVAAGQGSNDQLEKIRGELASARLESESLREQHITSQRDLLIAAQGAPFIDLDTLQKLTRGNIKHTDAGFVVVNDDGSPRTNADGSPTSIAEFYSDFAIKKPWLARGVVKSGGGGSSSGGVPVATDRYELTALFGPGSSAQEANKLSIQNPALYKKLRAEAKSRNLVV